MLAGWKPGRGWRELEALHSTHGNCGASQSESISCVGTGRDGEGRMADRTQAKRQRVKLWKARDRCGEEVNSWTEEGGENGRGLFPSRAPLSSDSPDWRGVMYGTHTCAAQAGCSGVGPGLVSLVGSSARGQTISWHPARWPKCRTPYESTRHHPSLPPVERAILAVQDPGSLFHSPAGTVSTRTVHDA